MSAELKQAVVNETLGISHLFAQNCALKYALPEKPVKQQVGPLPEAKVEPPVVNITNQIPAAPAANDSPSPLGAAAAGGKSLVRRAAPFLLTVAGAGLPAAGLSYWLLKDRQPVPQVTAPAEKDGSLLQHLEDNGFHLEGETWTK